MVARRIPDILTPDRAERQERRGVLEAVGRRATDDELAVINRKFGLELRPDDVYTFRAVASTNALDAYFTRMDPDTTLRRYTSDFRAGVPLLTSHDPFRLPVGRSFDAALEEVDGREPGQSERWTHQVMASFYMLRNHEIDGRDTEALIRGILGGVLSDVSIGFGGRDCKILCDEDKSDIFDWDSDYYPGQPKKDGGVVTYTVFDANAIEESLVYSGGSPGAVVQRVAGLVARRAIPPGEILRLEQRWHVRFERPSALVPGWTNTARIVSGFGGTDTQGGSMSGIAEQVGGILQRLNTRVGKTLSQPTRDAISAAIATLSASGAGIQEVEAALTTLLESADKAADEDERATLAALPSDRRSDAGVRRLLALSAAGERYTKTIIDETVRARVAVLGDGFDADKYRQRLERSAADGDLEHLEEERAAWTAQRGQAYTAGRVASRTDPNAHIDRGELKLHIEERPLA